MSPFETAKHHLSKLRIPEVQTTDGDDIENFSKQADEHLREIVDCEEVLCANERLIGKLHTEEFHLNQVIRSNFDEIYKMKKRIGEMECVLNVQKEEIDTQKRDHEIIAQRLRQSASIDTTLCQAMMDHLGVRLKMTQIDQENWTVEFYFDDEKHVTLAYNVLERYFDLQSIQPPHPAFDEIRNFLQNTEDISGFLYAVRRHHFYRN